MKRSKKKMELERITVDRKIVEGLISGHSLTFLTKSFGKGKGYVSKIRDLALEYEYIEPIAIDGSAKIFKAGAKMFPPFPESLFPLRDGRSEKLSDTDLLLDPKRDWIKERLELSWSPQTIFEELPLAVPRSNFYRYLHRQNLMAAVASRNVIELIHAPGECLQVDWGKLFDVVDHVTGKKKTIWIFIGVLGHSRFELARVVEKLDYTTTIEILISMLEELGGVPRKITTDNPKVFVRTASDYEPLINPAFERFASAYGFIVEALPPASPSMKGKVERMMPVKRRLFESYDLSAYSLSSAQAHLDRKLLITNERRHGAHQARPIDVFIEDEASVLKALPPLRYELETIVTNTIRSDGYVRFENKYYRVDKRLKKQEALLIGNSSQVSIYLKGRLLEVYERITDRFVAKACKEHYRESWEKTLEDHGHYLKRAAGLGIFVEQFVNIVLARGQGFVDTKIIWGLLTLDKTYENVDINKACEMSLGLSQLTLRGVQQFLKITAVPKKKRTPGTEDPLLPKAIGGKFARPISDYKKHLLLIHSKP